MKSLKFFLLTAALFLYGLITVVTCAAVWGAGQKAVVAVVAGLLLAANGYAIYRKAMAMKKTIEENGGIK
jgi:hypothetical protein